MFTAQHLRRRHAARLKIHGHEINRFSRIRPMLAGVVIDAIARCMPSDRLDDLLTGQTMAVTDAR